MTNFGSCPYCNGFLGLFELPERTPCYAIVECAACYREVWYRFSRVDPAAWKINDFEKEFIIDHKKGKIEEGGADNGIDHGKPGTCQADDITF